MPAFLIPLLLLALTLLAGYWVSRKGRPIDAIRFNVHKFLALGAVIVGAIRVYPLLKAGGTAALLGLSVTLAVLVVALFASGAVLSRPGTGNPRLKLAHAVLAYAALACAGGVGYLLL